MSQADEQKAPGLRERKRERLRATIELAALDLMTRHGYQEVTVEMICDTAEVSRRTFFNYFGSKEAVIIGQDPGPIPEDIQESFINGPRGSILADLARMLLTALEKRPRHIPPETWHARIELIRHEPTLAKAMADQIAAKDADLAALVSRRIRTRYAASGMTAGTTESAETQIARQSGFIVAMWWGIARYAIQSSVEHPEVSIEELIESLLDTFTLIQEAEL